LVTLYIEDETSVDKLLKDEGSIRMMLQQSPTIVLEPGVCSTIHRGVGNPDDSAIIGHLWRQSVQLKLLLSRIHFEMALVIQNEASKHSVTEPNSPALDEKLKTRSSEFWKFMHLSRTAAIRIHQ
jgi:hypothetical protein